MQVDREADRARHSWGSEIIRMSVGGFDVSWPASDNTTIWKEETFKNGQPILAPVV